MSPTDNATFQATQLAETANQSDVIFLSVASPFVRSATQQLAQVWGDRQPPVIILLSKGLEAHTGRRLSEIIVAEWPEAPVCVLSGGSHAEEVSQDLPFSLVAASRHEKIAQLTADLFRDTPACVIPSSDVIGVELSAALKNLIAMAAGIGDGLQLGDNFRGALITQGLAELSTLLKAAGAAPQTVLGPAGLGDLLATALSDHSRNRCFGLHIGRGLTVPEAQQAVGMVVEGINVTEGALRLARHYGVTLRFAQTISDILRGIEPPSSVVQLIYPAF